MAPAGFEPAIPVSEGLHTYALDHVTIGTDNISHKPVIIIVI